MVEYETRVVDSRCIDKGTLFLCKVYCFGKFWGMEVYKLLGYKLQYSDCDSTPQQFFPSQICVPKPVSFVVLHFYHS